MSNFNYLKDLSEVEDVSDLKTYETSEYIDYENLKLEHEYDIVRHSNKDYYQKEFHWMFFMEDLISPDLETLVYWGLHHPDEEIKNKYKGDACHLRIWDLPDQKIVLLSQNSDCFHTNITIASGYIATVVNKLYLKDDLNSLRFFESCEYQFINNAPYFHEISYSLYKKDGILHFCNPRWENATSEFCQILKLPKPIS